MRSNLPVTQREYSFPSDQTLVSVTDLKGRIVYCNAPFVAVSGFTREELMGQPHNLVRHPDMPSEAFRDMWETMESGKPWSGLVKNRRKDGDHYWVMANATPIQREGKAVGYLSVRVAPDRQQVAEIEPVYARMREQAESGHATLGLHHGKLVNRSLLGKLRRPQSHLGANRLGRAGLGRGDRVGGRVGHGGARCGVPCRGAVARPGRPVVHSLPFRPVDQARAGRRADDRRGRSHHRGAHWRLGHGG